MKKVAVVISLLVVFFGVQSDACVGKLLHIGVLNSSEGKVLSEMLASLITERTGTTVSVVYYKSTQELYDAMQGKQVDIAIENTARAMKLLNQPAETDPKKAYEFVKAAYEKEKGMIWLKPFGFTGNSGTTSRSYTATILRVDILNNFPVLPRVINKLGGMIDDESYARLIKSAEGGEKPKTVARDFLKSKKLI
ncbi:MAG: hypothetical protein FIA94_01995 [Nitrospirae bacterium]|nr:hypothetical protein [Nitrospirota bacterium]